MPAVIVAGSSGHLGEALIRVMRQRNIPCVGIDVLPSEAFTTHVGSISDKNFVASIFAKYEADSGIQGVINTAVLHKPHIVSHSMQDFVNVNITGTLTLLECFAQVQRDSNSDKRSNIPDESRFFIQTSTTSTYGDSLVSKDKSTITWIDESVPATPKNIYGVTKKSAEEICELFAKQNKIANVFVLQAARFFPEDDDDPSRVSQFSSNSHQQFVELFHRRVEIEDLVEVHLLAAQRAIARGTSTISCNEQDSSPRRGTFKRYICSAPSPFPRDAKILGQLATVSADKVIDSEVFAANGLWKELNRLYPRSFGKDIPVGTIDRIYCSDAAVKELGWNPKFTAESVARKLIERKLANPSDEDEDVDWDWRSDLAREVGKKGYHRQ